MKNKKQIIAFIIIAILSVLCIKFLGTEKNTNTKPNSNTVPVVQENDSSNKTLIDLLESKSNKSNNIGEQSKELVNSKYDFSMKYSDDWYEVKNAADDYKLPENVEVVGLVNGVNPMNYISIVLEKPYGKIDSKIYLNETKQVLLNKYNNCQIIKEKEVLASGKKSYGRMLQFSTENMTVTQYQVYIEGVKGIYIITYSSQSDSFEDNYQSFLNSLDSVKVN